MKTYIIYLLFSGCGLLSFIKTEEAKPSVYFPTGSSWLHYNGECPEFHYPIIIQGGAVPGDGTTFRAIFAKVPSSEFRYVTVHGLRNELYKKRQKKYAEQGYLLTYYQEFMAFGGPTHQAVWVKRGSSKDDGHDGEQDGADQSATDPESNSAAKDKPKLELEESSP